jgi:phage shock protein PspC (stress-responsive transcriptional regulator)
MDTTMTPESEPSAGDSGAEQPGPPRTAPGALTRSRNDRMVAGVAGGIARKYGFDPAFVRLAFVGLTIVSLGFGLIGYVVAWLVVPEADGEEPILSAAVRNARRHGPRRSFDKRFLLGLLLILWGANALADRANFPMHRVSHLFWPLLLIGGGAAVLLLRDREVVPPDAGPEPPTSAPPPPPRVPFGAVTGPASDVVDDSDAPPAASATDEPPVRTVPDDGPPSPPAPPYPPTAYPPTLPWPEPPRPPRAPRVRRERSMLGRLTWSVLLIVAGGAWLIDLSGAATIDPRSVIAIELAVVGVALLVGAWYGRARGLIAMGLLLTFFAGPLSVLDVPLRGHIGVRTIHAKTVDDLRGPYTLAVGDLRLDLVDTAFGNTAHRVVLTNAVGFIDVYVPPDVRVEVIARADAGSLDLFGHHETGGTHVHRIVFDDPSGATGPRLVIDAHVGFGAISVNRNERVPA